MFVMENPHAMMRLMPIMKAVPLTHTLYCFYGSKFRKRTDFFNNFYEGLDLIQGTQCPKKTVNVIDYPTSETYKIPPRLIRASELLNRINNAGQARNQLQKFFTQQTPL